MFLLLLCPEGLGSGQKIKVFWELAKVWYYLCIII
jgi:hypothetical protein